MSKALDKIKKIREERGMRSMEIEGIGRVYMKQLSLRDKEKIQDWAQKDGVDGEIDKLTHMVKTVITAIVDKDGNPVFGNEDKDELISGGFAGLVEQLFSWIYSPPDPEEFKKN